MTGTSARSVIDVVDPETGQPVGTAERDDALAAGLPIRTVHLFLFDTRQRLLLQLLGRGRDRHPLLRGSSVAAFPLPGNPTRTRPGDGRPRSSGSTSRCGSWGLPEPSTAPAASS